MITARGGSTTARGGKAHNKKELQWIVRAYLSMEKETSQSMVYFNGRDLPAHCTSKGDGKNTRGAVGGEDILLSIRPSSNPPAAQHVIPESRISFQRWFLYFDF